MSSAAIGKVEVKHEREYLELKKMLDEEETWVCEVCGHVHRGKKHLEPVHYVKLRENTLSENFWAKALTQKQNLA